ncbi:hypothetical protein YC2023_025462 [Brassica napus]
MHERTFHLGISPLTRRRARQKIEPETKQRNLETNMQMIRQNQGPNRTSKGQSESTCIKVMNKGRSRASPNHSI